MRDYDYSGFEWDLKEEDLEMDEDKLLWRYVERWVKSRMKC